MSHLDYPDNLVLHLERDSRSYKVYTTEEQDVFKVLYGLADRDAIITTSMNNLREIKQMFVDASINEYQLKLNLLFRKGLMGVAKELAEEYKTNNPAIDEPLNES
jgi:hypothetical protein